ncbi:hypothetical protein [Streptomyces mirabilis]
MSTSDWIPQNFEIRRIATNGTTLSIAVGGSARFWSCSTAGRRPHAPGRA